VRGLWELLRSYGIWPLGVWVVVIGLWVLTPARKVSAAREKAHEAYSGGVIHLRRLRDGEVPADTQGCLFGIGFPR
jgi:hypothetical protein